jgi:hypothetical protein
MVFGSTPPPTTAIVHHLTNDTIGELGENKKNGDDFGFVPFNFFKTLNPNFGVI